MNATPNSPSPRKAAPHKPDKPPADAASKATPARPRRPAAPRDLPPDQKGTPRHSAADGATRIVNIVEHVLITLDRFRVGWFFVGLLLLFLANNGLHIQVGTSATSLTPPLDRATKAVIELIGFTTIAAALATAFKDLLRNRTTRVLACALGLSGAALFAWSAAHAHGESMVKWGYDIVKDQYSAEPNIGTLSQYHGWSVMLVCLKLAEGKEEQAEAGVTFGKPVAVSTLRQGEPLMVSCRELAHPIVFGERVAGFVIVVPPGTSIEHARCLNDLLEAGCRVFSRTWNRVSINEGTAQALYSAFQVLSPQAQEAFLRLLRPAPVPTTTPTTSVGLDTTPQPKPQA